MAQSLESRINAALRSAARLKDVETVITDVEAEIASTTKKLDAETARSVDPALTTPQAREARNNAADLEHDVRRLNASLGMLVETRDKIVADNAEEQRLKRLNAAKTERDALALHIRSRYPEIGMELLALANRIQASNAEIAIVNGQLSGRDEKLKPAEYLARDCGFYWDMGRGGGPITHIAQINFPFLSRSGGYLPIKESTAEEAMWRKWTEADLEFAKRPIPGIDPAPEDVAASEPSAAA